MVELFDIEEPIEVKEPKDPDTIYWEELQELQELHDFMMSSEDDMMEI